MKYIITLLLFIITYSMCYSQAIADTIDVKYVNDTTWKVRRTLIFADGSDQPMGTLIAKSKSQVLNLLTNDVVDISRQYSFKLLDVLKGLPFISIVNRYNQVERVLPDSSLFIKLNQLFPLEEGDYEITDLRSKAKSIWKIALNTESNYFYVVTDKQDIQPVFITSDMHFRIGNFFDFIKTEKDTWMSLNGYTLKKK